MSSALGHVLSSSSLSSLASEHDGNTKTALEELLAEQAKQSLTQQVVLEYWTSAKAEEMVVDAHSTPNMDKQLQLSGYGWAPWEIHRPQKALIQLAKRGAFKGRVCDIGCGIGDNALFLASHCNCHVTAFDVLDRCIAFARTKASIRRVGGVAWHVANVLTMEGECLRPGTTYDVLFECGVFSQWGDEERGVYVANLAKVAHPGTLYYQLCVCEKDAWRMPPRKVKLADLHACFSEAAGWRVLSVEASFIESHPNVANGRREAYLATILRI